MFASRNRLSRPEQFVDIVWCCTAFIECTIFIDLFVYFLCYYWYFYFYYGLHIMVIILISSIHYQLNFVVYGNMLTAWILYYIILYYIWNIIWVSGWLSFYTIEQCVQLYHVKKLQSMKWWFPLCTRKICLVWLS